MKTESIIKEGSWYCTEKCTPSSEEMLMEEQRKMAEFTKDDSFVNSETNQDEDMDEEYKEEEEDYYVDGDIHLDLNIGKNPIMLTMEELEQKYKRNDEVQIKVSNKQKDELNDSLEL